jgi:diketogulonate reductase-like aldo/keto reductase
MVENDNLRFTKMALNNGSGAIPALGFGTLIPDPIATRTATKAALEAGFRALDASERYRNEKEVPEDAMREIREGITSRIRFNAVVQTGVPGFIPREKRV